MSNRSFGIAFIGCGGYNALLAQAAAKSTVLRPIACYDVRAESANAFADMFGIKGYENLDEMLARDDINGVVIATPNNAHKSNVSAAVNAGKHVFVDKPIANTIEDALEIISMTAKAGVTLAIGHNGRRMAGHRKMKAMIDEGAIGTPVTVEANFSHAGGLGLNPSHWRFYRDECPALPLMQLGVHFADTIQYLLGNVTEVSSFMSHVATPADNDDVTVSLLRFGNGLLGYLGSNYASPSVYYVNVYGTGGNLYCQDGMSLRYRKAGGGDEQISLERTDTQLEELEEFARCAVEGRQFEVNGDAALHALAIVRAALKSNEERRPVSISDIITGAD